MSQKKKDIGILIADDEGEMRNLLASILRSCGYWAIGYASDGSQALATLEQEGSAVGIAFLDINMPGLTGIEVVLRARASRPDCFCVIVSAHSALENVLAALEAGARGFIVKPYNIRKIAEVLDKYARESAAPQ